MGACASSASHSPSPQALALLPCSGPACGGPVPHTAIHILLPSSRKSQVLPLGPAATVAAETVQQVELAPFAAGAQPAKLPMGGCLLWGIWGRMAVLSGFSRAGTQAKQAAPGRVRLLCCHSLLHLRVWWRIMGMQWARGHRPLLQLTYLGGWSGKGDSQRWRALATQLACTCLQLGSGSRPQLKMWHRRRTKQPAVPIRQQCLMDLLDGSEQLKLQTWLQLPHLLAPPA